MLWGEGGGAPGSRFFALADALRELSARSLDGRSGAELGDDLIELRRLADGLELEFSRTASAFSRTDEYDQSGYVSPYQWIRANCHMTASAAVARVTVGERLVALPQSERAVRAGEIGFAHLVHLAHAFDFNAESPQPLPFDEGKLVAKAANKSVGEFMKVCEHIRHAADRERFETDEKIGLEARRLTLKADSSGMVWVRGILDAEGAAVVRNALEPLARPVGVGDDRPVGKRNADAWVEMAKHCLDTGVVPQVNGQKPHLQITASVETVRGQVGAPAAELALSTTPISSKAVERLSCDCNVVRVLLNSDSAVVDVGRATRKVAPATRRALNVRDEGCRWPGCDRPSSWTDAHHIIHWKDGGPTELENLVLLCHRHHWMVHEGGWQLVLENELDVRVIAPIPDWWLDYVRGPAMRDQQLSRSA